MVELEIAAPPTPDFDVILPGSVVFSPKADSTTDVIRKSIERWIVKLSYAPNTADLYIQRYRGDSWQPLIAVLLAPDIPRETKEQLDTDAVMVVDAMSSETQLIPEISGDTDRANIGCRFMFGILS